MQLAVASQGASNVLKTATEKVRVNPFARDGKKKRDESKMMSARGSFVAGEQTEDDKMNLIEAFETILNMVIPIFIREQNMWDFIMFYSY